MKLIIRVFLHIIITIALCSTSFAFQLAELQTETAEDLLLFFEEEELIIATRHKTTVRKAPAIATVITAKEIRNMGARNLLDILRKIPGIGVSIADVPVYESIEIRGIRTTLSDKILFMIDGHTINNTLQGSGRDAFGDISVESIKRIEVIRGPGSALYGANAFTAIINIVTMDAEDINGLQVTAGGGSFDTQHYNLLFGHEEGKFKITAFFDYIDTNGASLYIEEDATGASGETLSWQEKPDIGLNISYGDITFRGRYIEQRRGPYIGVNYALNDETVQYMSHVYGDLSYNMDTTDNLDITARLYGDLIEGKNVWELFPEGYLGIYTDGLLGSPIFKNSIVGGELTADYSFSKHMLTTGIMYEHARLYDTKRLANFNPFTFAPLDSLQDVTDWANYTENAERDIWAVYVQDILSITEDASLTVGVRHDHYSDFGGTTNPRAGLVWEFMKDTSLKLLYGKAFKAPTFSQLYFINNPVSVGNPDLNPEKIDTYEAGLEHRFLNNYTMRLNYFYNKLEDLIALGDKPSATEPAFWVNKGTAEVQGVEAELLFNFGSDYYGYINYSYQDAKDKETDEKLPDVPSHRANAGINLAPWRHLNANINISWTGKRPRAEGDTRDDLSSQRLVDLTLIAKNFFKTLEIRGSVYNLFDEDYRDPSPFPIKVPNDYPTNERMVMVEARYKF